MSWACPKCGHACPWTARECPVCSFPLTLGAVTRHYWHRLRTGLSRATAVECPECQQATPITRKFCVHCGAALTVQAAVNVTVAPTQRRWANFKRHSSPQTWRRIRYCYFLFSASLLWWFLTYVETHHAGSRIAYIALSVVYLSVLSFLAAWLAPRHIFFAFSRASRLAKLSLILNYLTALLGLQLWIAAWWGQALSLAGLFFVTWLGAVLLCRWIMPVAAATADVFLGSAPGFDASAPQGREARYD